ncbi:helix-turn-helix domain-containing protein [Carnobacterium maltaromaticum]|uniref:helix-turn-helix domain-containing protein n=1 Tax=Carnobacterium maltaromaticum TaxID=2751 RepID=UPI00026C8D89|nr:Rgg/GadR/MutR family transcriptional regulator [Carnobacterium maltaromaticum]
MKGYGEAIRTIRISKGLKLKDVYSDILSKSYSISFEKGNHEISLRLLEHILDRLLLNLDEFLYIYNNYRLPEKEEFLQRYSEASNQNDIDKLKILLHENEKGLTLSSRLKSAQVRSRLRQLIDFNENHIYRKDNILKEDIKLITDYLYSLDSWTLQEIILFTNSLDFIDYTEKVDLFRQLLPSLEKYKNHTHGRLAICGLLTNVVHELLMDGEKKFSKVLLDDLNLFSNSITDIFFKIIHRYYEGLYLILIGQADSGYQQSMKSIEILKELDHTHISRLFKSILDDFLKKIKSN